MGLLLSTLVFCVGVIELITFFHNVRRHVEYPPVRGNLSHIKDGYIRELQNTRRKLIEDLEKAKEAPDIKKNDENKFVVHDFHVTRTIPTFRLNSHEDIEIEYNGNLGRSKSSSPRRFLITEKEKNSNTFDSNRRFVVSEESQTIRRSKSQSSLPEFFIREEKNSEKSPNSPRYVLQEQQGSCERPIPLPRQFIVSETELNSIVFKDEKIESTNKTEYIRRSPSPFPTLEFPQNHRNSLCSELIEFLSLDSVQEEQKSRSASPNTVIEHIPQEEKIICNDEVIQLVSPQCVQKSFYSSSSNDDNFIRIVTDRTRSKSESDSSERSNQRSLECQPRTSSISELSDQRKVQSKIELELEEAIEEHHPAHQNITSNKPDISKSSDIDIKLSSETNGKKNDSNKEIERDSISNEDDKHQSKVKDDSGPSEDKKKEPEAFWVKSVE